MSCENCGVVKDATKRIQKDRRAHELKKLALVCLTVVLVAACICATVVGCYTIKAQQDTIIEQQYALNMQYAQLMEYVAGAEITTETVTNEADAGDGGTAIAGNDNMVVGGNDNTVVGGDLHGEG